ncbi:8498_t:CDS:1, partial [Acaulospora morrowiae]
MRGNSVIDDLRILVNNPRYSDLEIKCKDDVIVYGNRAILAARSEAFDEILFAKTEIYEKQILFQTIEASHMKIILDYLYTGSISERDLSVDNVFEILHAVNFFRLKNLQDFISEYYKKMCRKWGNDNKSPELLSKAAHLLSSLPNNEIVDYLIDSVAKIPLDSIGFNRLTLQGLQCLLSKRNEKKFFASSEYSVLRYAVLTAAKKVSQEAFLTLKKRLPPWEDVKRTVQIINHNSPIKEEISLPVFNYINSL